MPKQKAELGTLTDADWAATVGVLRTRGGITAGLTTKPTLVDPYLKSVYFPNITDPVILEVRRERGIELCLEGFRFSDILRWKRGDLMNQEWNGFYVPALNTPMDLNEDAINDVVFYQGNKTKPRIISYLCRCFRSCFGKSKLSVVKEWHLRRIDMDEQYNEIVGG